MKKFLALVFSILFASSFFLSQDKPKPKQYGYVHVYLGIFNLQNLSLDHYIHLPDVAIKLINKETKETTHVQYTDPKGYTNFKNVLPGNYFLSAETENGSFFFHEGILIIKEEQGSKVYLHLEQEMDLKGTKEEVEGIGLMSQLPNLVGRLYEVSNSPFVLRKTKSDLDNKTKEKPKKKKKK